MSVFGSVLAPAGAVLAAHILTVALAEPARRLAVKHRLTDRPAAYKAHQRPTPYLGGITLAVGTLVPAVAVAVTRHAGLRLWPLLAAALAVATLGLIDDVRGLRAGTRLAVETVLAGGVVASGVRLPLPGPRWLDMTLTVVMIVVVTNSFNLLDNSDGALATVACVTSAPLAVCALLGGQPALGLVLCCLSAGCAGFLLHNAPPARIFLGDAGSLFVGFLIATGAAAVGPVRGGGAAGVVAFPLLVVFLPVMDTALVVVSRRLHGLSWWQGNTDHLAHRLRRLGLGSNALLAVLTFSTTVTSLLAALVFGGLLPARPVLLGATVTGVVLIVLLLRVPGYPAGRAPVESDDGLNPLATLGSRG